MQIIVCDINLFLLRNLAALAQKDLVVTSWLFILIRHSDVQHSYLVIIVLRFVQR